MSIEFVCNCGRKLRAPESAAGQRGRCPACREVFTVPTAVMITQPEAFTIIDDSPDLPLAPVRPAIRSNSLYIPQSPAGFNPAAVAPRPVLPAAPPVPAGSKAQGYLYALLLLMLIPLGWSTLHGKQDELVDHLKLTYEHHPELADRLDQIRDSEEGTISEILAVLPAGKLDGALLPKDTYGHWIMAAFSGAAFMSLVLLLFPLGHAKIWHLILIAIFTGTAGIALLLGFQYLAFHMPLFRGSGWITLLLDLIWLIGQSYALTFGQHGFIVSFLGFTAGVGFCEEACKALPMIFMARRTGFASWRAAMLWGLLSGVGFGVSEGITYASDYYNGIYGSPIYVVRFVSCVALHAMWAAAVGITIFRRQDYFRDKLHPLEWIYRTLQVVIVPMVLHGLYDTLLTQKLDLYALLIALLSFGWLTWQIEKAKRDFDVQEQLA